MYILTWRNNFRVGDYDLNDTDIEEQEYEIVSVNNEPDFNVGPYLNNDIAIVTVGSQIDSNGQSYGDSEGIKFGKFVGAACLPPENFL